MKHSIFLITTIVLVVAGLWLNAADHLDAPEVGSLSEGSSSADITDYYAFESPSNPDNYVFVCNVLALTAPAATGDVVFDENLMYEVNIDNDGDLVEDLVIQVFFREGKAVTFGPVVPNLTGIQSNIAVGIRAETEITQYGDGANIGENGEVKIFAGPRDDPFYMDFFRFVDIVNGAGAALDLEVAPPMDGNQYPTSFATNGTDTFAGTNVLSIVVEVPKSSLGSSNTFSSWVESKRKS